MEKARLRFTLKASEETDLIDSIMEERERML